MAKPFLSYDNLLQEALRGVVREALAQVAARGLLGNHHFFITFRTGHPGVVMPPYLRAEHPEELTIVLQHQFSGLEVSDDAFSVTLSFNKIPAPLTVPFAALTHFADPPANFGLQFTPDMGDGRPALPGERPAPAAAEGESARAPRGAESAAEGEEAGSAKVVALDSFRKS